MNTKFSNDEAIAYSMFMIPLALGALAIAWLVLASVSNEMITSYFNPEMAAGHVSMQTKSSVDFQMNMLRYAPPIFLIFWMFWALHRAKVVSEGG